MGERSSTGSVLGADLVDGVFVFELNRPEARNAISPDMVAALNDALSRFQSDDSAKAGVITGAGSAFCAGLDLKVFAATDADAERRTVGALLRRFGQLTKPMIGAINGPAIAGGLELALSFNIATADGELIASLRELYDANMNRSLDDALAAEQVELERWRQSSPRTWSA